MASQMDAWQQLKLTFSILNEFELRLTQTTSDDQEIHNREHLLIGLFQGHGNKAVTKKKGQEIKLSRTPNDVQEDIKC